VRRQKSVGIGPIHTTADREPEDRPMTAEEWRGHVLNPAEKAEHETVSRPTFFRFGDVDAIEITRHLNYNGGRAAELIAAATRLDGDGYSNPRTIIRTAIWFLTDELTRIDTWEEAPLEQRDAIRPDYYKFGNTEAINVSRHLNSNGGQAFQYVVRSTRLDGNNKGDPRENIRKAIYFLEDEIKRLGEQEEQ